MRKFISLIQKNRPIKVIFSFLMILATILPVFADATTSYASTNIENSGRKAGKTQNWVTSFDMTQVFLNREGGKTTLNYFNVMTVNGKDGFCGDPSNGFGRGGTYDSAATNAHMLTANPAVRNITSAIMTFGYYSPAIQNVYDGKKWIPINNADRYSFTQMTIWEMMLTGMKGQGISYNPNKTVVTQITFSDPQTQKAYASWKKQLFSGIYSMYDVTEGINNTPIKNFVLDNADSIAPTIQLDKTHFVKKDTTVSITDTNKALQHYQFSNGGKSISVSGGGTIRMDSNVLRIDLKKTFPNSLEYNLRHDWNQYITKTDPNGVLVWRHPVRQWVAEYLGFSGKKGFQKIRLTFEEELGGFSIRKVDSVTKKVLPGATFRITGPSGTKTGTTGADGYARFDNLKAGQYEILELEPPKGYMLPSSIQTHTVTVKPGITSASNQATIELPNTPKPEEGGFAIRKVDETGKALQGATFQVTGPNGFTTTITTDANGNAVLNKLKVGEYTLTETKTPTGYKLKTTPIKIMVVADVIGNTTSPNATIRNELALGTAKIIKMDAKTDRPLPGATFELKNTDTNVTYTLTTDITGEVSKSVPLGTYTVKEIKAPDGYQINKEIQTVTFTKDGEIKSIIYPNARLQGRFELTKTDEQTGNVLPGATFEVRNENGDVVTTFTTDANGKYASPLLDYGEYIIVETQAPAGYRLNNEPISVTIDQNTVDSENMVHITRVNAQQVGQIKIVKTEENKTNILLPNAVFRITTTDAKGNPIVVATMTTDEKGEAISPELPLGQYTLEEMTAPDGYVLRTDTIEVTIEKDHSIVEVEISNEKKVGNISVIKKDPLEDTNLQGAIFTVYNANNEVVGEITTDKEGAGTLSNLELGEYIVKETKAPEGYRLNEKPVKVVLETNGQTLQIEMPNKKPEKTTGFIELKKVDGDEKALQNAIFEVYDAKDNLVDRLTTDANGIARSRELPFGKYTVKEVESPYGFKLNPNPISVEIKSRDIDPKTGEFDMERLQIEQENPVIEVKVVNEKVLGSVHVKKLDDKNNVLEGAEFTLYDEKDQEVAKRVSGKDGMIVFENLNVGNYTLVETKAPKGYVQNPERIAISIDGINKTADVEVHVERINQPYKEIKVLKTDPNGNPLEGAEFTLYDKDQKPIATSTTDSKGEIRFEKLIKGQYTLKETKAPKGYNLFEETIPVDLEKYDDVTFEVSVDNYEMEENIPSTGTTGALPFAMVGISVLALAWNIQKRKKNKMVG